MQVKAKFYIDSVELPGWAKGEKGKVTLKAVSRGAENATWASASPRGELTMTVMNPGGFRFFKDHIGEEVSLTMQLAKNDPATHAYVAPADEDVPHTIGARPTCMECGHDEDDHQ